MQFHVGIFIIIISLIVGYLGEGGALHVLFQPFSVLIIVGSGMGILIISNPKHLLRSIWINIPKMFYGKAYSREEYLELLVFLFNFFRYARQHSMVELEEHIEKPYKSSLFKQFPQFLKNREPTVFLCDYMRMLTLGYDNHFELENMMQEQINARKEYTAEISGALFRLGDTLPALGILAAILGLVNAMGSVDQSPLILGHKIASALFGTFIGIACAYCIVNPMGSFLLKFGTDESKYLECIKAGIISHARGNPPSISVEFARQTIAMNLKPNFFELEKTIESRKKIKLKDYVGREKREAATR
ncbi:MAG: flagellar motor stator protein MotA [Rickettsiales bacterium]